MRGGIFNRQPQCGLFGLAALVALLGPAPAAAENFWLLLEDDSSGVPTVTPRRFSAADAATLRALFNSLAPTVERPGGWASLTGSGRDMETLPLSEKVLALRKISALGMDLTHLTVPPGTDARFGPALQQVFTQVLQAAGIGVVTPDEAKTLPGQPQLSIFLSVTEASGGCSYAYTVFASLTQTAVLSNDPDVKLPVGVWSFMVKSAPGAVPGGEADGILQVAAALVRDWTAARNVP